MSVGYQLEVLDIEHSSDDDWAVNQREIGGEENGEGDMEVDS